MRPESVAGVRGLFRSSQLWPVTGVEPMAWSSDKEAPVSDTPGYFVMARRKWLKRVRYGYLNGEILLCEARRVQSPL